LTLSTRISGRLFVIVLAAFAIAACAAPKRAKRHVPTDRPTAGDSSSPPQISACRDYADNMAGRQMERDFDSIQGNFQGGSSQVFKDFARMDAQRYYRQLYESCISRYRAQEAETTNR